MSTVSVAFTNAYSSTTGDADFLVIWNPSEKDMWGYVPVVDGCPRIFMNNTLEVVRENRGETRMDPSSLVVRNPSHADAAIGIIFYSHGTPESVPETESSSLFHNGVSVRALIHVFPAASAVDCAVVVQSTPKLQWQTNTYTDRNYKRVETFPAKPQNEDRRCTIC
jgi:hypothetical protein